MSSLGSSPQPTMSVTASDLRKLLKLFACTHYKSRENDKRTGTIEDVCVQLFCKDYPSPIVICNENGELSNNYPSKIVIPQAEDFVPNRCRFNNTQVSNEKEANNTQETHFQSRLDPIKIKDLMCKARVARCRARFPIPVILYKNKYICRSATLSGGAEIYGRSVYDYYTFNDNRYQTPRTCQDDEFVEAIVDESPPLPRSLTIADASQLFSKVRNQDIKLLKYFSVNHICDLMLEKKKVKFGMNVTSSEKADKENRYSDFNIMSLPYPGCEFFREFRDNSYSAEGLVYNWNQNFVDARLDLPNCERISKRLNINFKDYRSWDVVKLTQNYMKLLLCLIRECDSSILIHCISGWDRTPLFMSLLRLSLWADGEIHKTLSPIEITYLTVAYDWFLFGHNLNDRLNKGEEIMFFCFQFLKFITEEQYSINCDLFQLDYEDECDAKRKISVDSYTNDFVTIPNPYGGSCSSLNSNGSLNSSGEPALYFPMCSLESKQEEPLSSSLISTDLEKLRLNSDDHFDIFTNSTYTHMSYSRSCSPQEEDEMVSTLTSSDTIQTSKSKPMEIPKANGNNNKNSTNTDNGSLSRSDSWQFVSDAGSIRDTSLLSNQFSSPDSVRSLRKDILDHSPLFGSIASQHSSTPEDRMLPTKYNKRKKKLLEVRSLFNSAYTALLNGHYNSGGRLTNLVDHFVGPFYTTRESIE